MILLVLTVVLLVVALLLSTIEVRRRRSAAGQRVPPTSTGRILFPFVSQALSKRALNAAFRLAAAEQATVIPVCLTRVPLSLPLDTPIPRQLAIALPVQEAIEHHAASRGIRIDSRIERGRTYRHALKQAVENEQYDRIVIAAANQYQPGFGADDIAWLLTHAPGEIVVLRPANDADALSSEVPTLVHVGPLLAPEDRQKQPEGRQKRRRFTCEGGILSRQGHSTSVDLRDVKRLSNQSHDAPVSSSSGQRPS